MVEQRSKETELCPTCSYLKILANQNETGENIPIHFKFVYLYTVVKYFIGENGRRLKPKRPLISWHNAQERVETLNRQRLTIHQNLNHHLS